VLVRLGPEVQAVLRIGPNVTDPAAFDTGDETVDAALTDLAATDPVAANQAEAAFGALTWGQGLQIVSRRSVQEFLWYQLPSKFAVSVEEHREIAQALGGLFDRVGLPRYADSCRSPVTDSILTAYDTGGRETGITAYRKALEGGGVEPPDIPGLLAWGGMLGVEEHAAFWSLADHLELAITAGAYPRQARLEGGGRRGGQRLPDHRPARARRRQLPGPDPRRTPRPVGRLPRTRQGRPHPSRGPTAREPTTGAGGRRGAPHPDPLVPHRLQR
jgi:hypothetical protein